MRRHRSGQRARRHREAHEVLRRELEGRRANYLNGVGQP
jgi:hypothetical protein